MSLSNMCNIAHVSVSKSSKKNFKKHQSFIKKLYI